MIGFILTADEGAREEKHAFYRCQAARLDAAGIDARVFEFTGTEASLPEAGWLAVFDVESRPALRSVLDGTGIRQAPIVWNPYRFFQAGQGWIRQSDSIVAAIAPSPAVGRLIRRYQLRKPVLDVTVSAELSGRGPAGRPSNSGPVSRIGYFSATKVQLAHIRGAVSRLRPDFAGIEWVEMDYEKPDAWRRSATDCELFLSVRRLCGSALPLLDLMASGVIVCGTHGGGLRDIATEENGLWVDSATPDKFIDILIEGLTRLCRDPDYRRNLADNARLSALRFDPDATFEENLPVWKKILALAALDS